MFLSQKRLMITSPDDAHLHTLLSCLLWNFLHLYLCILVYKLQDEAILSDPSERLSLGDVNAHVCCSQFIAFCFLCILLTPLTCHVSCPLAFHSAILFCMTSACLTPGLFYFIHLSLSTSKLPAPTHSLITTSAPPSLFSGCADSIVTAIESSTYLKTDELIDLFPKPHLSVPLRTRATKTKPHDLLEGTGESRA